MIADYCAICGLHLGTIGDGGLCAECRADWDDDDDWDIAELEQAWPQLPLGLEGIDRFSDYPITGGEEP